MIVRVDAYPALEGPALATTVAREGLGVAGPYRAVAREFPSLTLGLDRASGDVDRPGHARGRRDRATARELKIRQEDWQSPSLDFWKFDEEVDRIARGAEAVLVLSGPPGWRPGDLGAVLTRCQRWIRRENEASRSSLFRRILRCYRRMFDLTKPLALADYRHALDTWQWTLRLEPEAGLPVQLAALLHDVERLASETERRVEHQAADYRAFKKAHATQGASMARALLLEQGVGSAVAERTRELIEGHEASGSDRELSLLNDADGLSFFSLNSAGYFDYFGPAQATRKIRYTIARMGGESIARLASLRLRPEVEKTLAEELGW